MAKPELDQALESEQASKTEGGVSWSPKEEADEGSKSHEEPEANEENEGNEENGENADQEAPPQSPRTGFKAILLDILETLLLTIIIYAVLSTFIGRYKVLSVSMEPNLYEGQYLLISKQTHKIWPLRRGDVVVFQFPRDPKKNYIKRVIGLPGEKVGLDNGKLYINDEFISEPWSSGQTRGTLRQWELGEDEYFVMGDNRSNSSDSRAWGPVNSQMIIGKALFCYWPIECWGLIKNGPKPTPIPVTPFESILTDPLLPAGTAP